MAIFSANEKGSVVEIMDVEAWVMYGCNIFLTLTLLWLLRVNNVDR